MWQIELREFEYWLSISHMLINFLMIVFKLLDISDKKLLILDFRQ